MAIVEFRKADLERLVGRKLTDRDYRERIPMLGCPLEKIDRESVWFEIFPDRPDMLSLEGFARAVKHFLDIEKPKISYDLIWEGKELKVEKVRARPEIVAGIVRGIKLTDDLISSLMQVQEKIHETLGRGRKKVAIGIHDLDKIEWPLLYCEAGPDSISFVPLGDRKEMTLREICQAHPKGMAYGGILKESKKWPVILDSHGRVISFPPIINSELTKVTQKTRNLFIDITGTHLPTLEATLNILMTSFWERGCRLEAVRVGKRIYPDLNPRKLRLDLRYANKLLDLDLKPWELKPLLERMGLGYENGMVIIPPYRIDIMHQIDLVEELAIAYGYHNFEPKIPQIPTLAKRLERNEVIDRMRDLLAGFGFQEIMGAILTNEENEFEKMERPATPCCETLNPLSSECTICRTSLLPSILKALSQNKHNPYPQKIFEIGDILLLNPKAETGTEVRKRLSAAISDERINYSDLAAVLRGFMHAFGLDFSLRAVGEKAFIPGRTAAVFCRKVRIGTIGEIHPAILKKWDLEMPVVAMEIDLENILSYLTSQPQSL